MSTEIQTLQRWMDFGGTCRLVEHDVGRAEVLMCRCDGGEVIDRLTTDDPRVLAWVREHQT